MPSEVCRHYKPLRSNIELARQFLGGAEALEFRASSVGEKYNWIEKVMTRYEKLKSLSQAESYLRLSITSEGLNTVANQMSDNQFAERMVNARSSHDYISFCISE